MADVVQAVVASLPEGASIAEILDEVRSLHLENLIGTLQSQDFASDIHLIETLVYKFDLIYDDVKVVLSKLNSEMAKNPALEQIYNYLKSNKEIRQEVRKVSDCCFPCLRKSEKP